jgi:hypothetical protein
MEIEKIFLYFWLPTRTNNKNLVIGRIFFSKFGKIESFFSWKILLVG